MPSYSGRGSGQRTIQIPAGSTNVRFSIGAASGGGSASTTWNHSRGGFGRSGDFRLTSRDYTYNLTFYMGREGSKGQGPANPGGSGGYSPLASGGNGYRSGGGGGGASGVYDGGLNRYTVIVGGGGGAGRFDNNTGYGGYYTAGRGIGGGGTTSGIGGRNGGNAPAGHRGGGGGGSSTGGAGGLGGATTTNGYAGIGGNSAWYSNGSYYQWTYNSGYSNYGDGFYTLSFDYAKPNIQYFTISPDQIVRGGSAQLTYQITGYVTTVSLTDFGGNQPQNQSPPGITIQPVNDRTYTLSAFGPGGTTSQSISVDVLIPPIPTLTTTATDNTIIQGQSTFLEYTITGDVSLAQISPGIGPINIQSTPIQISPTTTTTYTITASHPLAGQGSDQVTVTVITPPVITLTYPLSVDYGENINLNVQSENATTSLQLLVRYYYADNTYTDYELVEDLPIADVVDRDVIHTPTYNNLGPTIIEYKLYAIGEGSLTAEDIEQVSINIDRMPDAIDIPETDDTFKNEEPVVTPDVEVTSQRLLVDDIDIPVEVKADYPIQLEIDDSGIYVDIREI